MWCQLEPMQSQVSKDRHSGLLPAERTHVSYPSSDAAALEAKVRRRAETSGKSTEASQEEHMAPKSSPTSGATLGRKMS